MVFLILGMILLGIYGGFFGAGSGTFFMVLLVATGYSYLNGAALARIIGACMSMTAAITFVLNGMVHFPYGISVGIGYGLGGWIGAGMSLKKGEPYIRLLLMVIIVVSVIKLLV